MLLKKFHFQGNPSSTILTQSYSGNYQGGSFTRLADTAKTKHSVMELLYRSQCKKKIV
jgi:hypothetical protein